MAANVFLDLPGGVKMPALGLGTFQAHDEVELIAALNAALQLGYRHIDTAYAYENEKPIGEVLRQWIVSGKLKREDLFITAKLPMQGVHPDRVEYFMKESLKNLQLDYVDLYLIHFPIGCKFDIDAADVKTSEAVKMEVEPKTDHAAVWKKMEEQVDAGRARTIGLSNYTIPQMQTVLKAARIKPANLQIEVHVYLQAKNLIDFCNKNDISVVAYCPLGSPGYNQFLTAFGQKSKQLPNILGDAVISKIAEKHSKTPAQIALRFLIQKGLAPIPKSVTPKRLRENIGVFDFSLDDKDMKELTKLEVGEKARVADFKFFEGLENHPDFPIKSNCVLTGH